MCSALRFCLSVYLSLSPWDIGSSCWAVKISRSTVSPDGKFLREIGENSYPGQDRRKARLAVSTAVTHPFPNAFRGRFRGVHDLQQEPRLYGCGNSGSRSRRRHGTGGGCGPRRLEAGCRKRAARHHDPAGPAGGRHPDGKQDPTGSDQDRARRPAVRRDRHLSRIHRQRRLLLQRRQRSGLEECRGRLRQGPAARPGEEQHRLAEAGPGQQHLGAGGAARRGRRQQAEDHGGFRQMGRRRRQGQGRRVGRVRGEPGRPALLPADLRLRAEARPDADPGRRRHRGHHPRGGRTDVRRQHRHGLRHRRCHRGARPRRAGRHQGSADGDLGGRPGPEAGRHRLPEVQGLPEVSRRRDQPASPAQPRRPADGAGRGGRRHGLALSRLRPQPPAVGTAGAAVGDGAGAGRGGGPAAGAGAAGDAVPAAHPCRAWPDRRGGRAVHHRAGLAGGRAGGGTGAGSVRGGADLLRLRLLGDGGGGSADRHRRGSAAGSGRHRPDGGRRGGRSAGGAATGVRPSRRAVDPQGIRQPARDFRRRRAAPRHAGGGGAGPDPADRHPSGRRGTPGSGGRARGVPGAERGADRAVHRPVRPADGTAGGAGRDATGVGDQRGRAAAGSDRADALFAAAHRPQHRGRAGRGSRPGAGGRPGNGADAAPDLPARRPAAGAAGLPVGTAHHRRPGGRAGGGGGPDRSGRAGRHHVPGAFRQRAGPCAAGGRSRHSAGGGGRRPAFHRHCCRHPQHRRPAGKDGGCRVLHRGGRRIPRADRAVRLRQIDGAADDQPADPRRRRRHPHRRRGHRLPEAGGTAPPHGLRHPVGRAVSALDGGTQHRHRPRPARLAQGAHPRPGDGTAGIAEPRPPPVPRRLSAPAVRRTAAARRRRPRPGGGAAHPADGRAVQRTRPDHPRQPPDRAVGHPSPHRHHRGLRHPRHGRGSAAGRQHRGDGPWPVDPVRHAAGHPDPSGQPAGARPCRTRGMGAEAAGGGDGRRPRPPAGERDRRTAGRGNAAAPRPVGDGRPWHRTATGGGRRRPAGRRAAPHGPTGFPDRPADAGSGGAGGAGAGHAVAEAAVRDAVPPPGPAAVRGGELRQPDARPYGAGRCLQPRGDPAGRRRRHRRHPSLGAGISRPAGNRRHHGPDLPAGGGAGAGGSGDGIRPRTGADRLDALRSAAGGGEHGRRTGRRPGPGAGFGPRPRHGTGGDAVPRRAAAGRPGDPGGHPHRRHHQCRHRRHRLHGRGQDPGPADHRRAERLQPGLCHPGRADRRRTRRGDRCRVRPARRLADPLVTALKAKRAQSHIANDLHSHFWRPTLR
ncbi:hypothetical protein Lal_00014503 [Lupinus albus]|nr:hypothetical protein Lal_00014503 [Lupinus albus]